MPTRLFCLLAILFASAAHAEERSLWLHASLGLFTQANYFGPTYPETIAPTSEEIANATRVLAGTGANRWYLIYHRELPIDAAKRIFRQWKQAAPSTVELVPALVLRMYDRAETPVFTPEQLTELASFFQTEVNANRLAIYDIAPDRDLSSQLTHLQTHFAGEFIRLGLQPTEPLRAPFSTGVIDTWSGFCHGRRTEEDWGQPGFGAETLRKWTTSRGGHTQPLIWDLIVVAWDYTATERGGYPGYDDAAKNQPLPTGRNRRAAELIRSTVGSSFGGFSSDLYILQENSRNAAHDGQTGSFYECLKRGEAYRGYYREPFEEIVSLYREAR